MAETVEPIIIPIEGKLSEESIQKVTNTFEELQKEAPQFNMIGDLPDVVRPMFNAMISTIKDQKGEISRALTSAIDGKAIGEQVNKMLLETVGFFGANVKTAASAGNALSKVYGSIPNELRKSFNSELSDIIRTTSSIVSNFTSLSGSSAKSDRAMERLLIKNSSFNKAYSDFSKAFSLPEEMQRELLSAVVKLSVPNVSRSDYIAAARQHAFGQLKKVDTIPQFIDYRERLPERFRSLPAIPQLTSNKQIRENQNLSGRLSRSQYLKVQNLAAENPTFEKALTLAGLATRTRSQELTGTPTAGTLIMPSKPISRAELGIALGYMDKDLFRPGMEGAPMWKHSMTSTDQRDQKSLGQKASRVATESFSAFDKLKDFGVDPIYVKTPKTPRYKYSQDKSTAIKSNVEVRPDMFQIQSLTWDDFRKGVVLDNATAKKQSIDDERAAGESVNKMISRSIYTDLLGMSGHNTYGSGAGEKRRILQIDLSDKMYKTQNGKLVYENGKPAANEDTAKLIQEIFTPRASIVSASGEEYRYPVVSYGSNGRYVPTNIKNGLIWLAEEEAYKSASKRFIDKYGANAFDNLIANDTIFSAGKDLNKALEARNRDLTPSVPISQLGGRLPDKRKIGFADLNYVTGLDGSSLWMPGYIPGGAGTLRSVSFKGSGMTVDYKRMYKDLYGEDAKWYVPFVNAPESIKKLYKEQGIEAARAAYQTPETRAKYSLGNSSANFERDFFDALRMDAIIDKSMIKTPFYNRMNLTEMQDAWTDIAEMTGGLRIVQTAKDFLTTSNVLSKQVAQNLDLTPGDIVANRKNWDNYIASLRDPQQAKSLVFSDLTVPLNKAINENPSLMWEIPEARSKIQEAIAAAENDRNHNRIFAKGDILNALALPNIGEIMLKTGELNGAAVRDKNLASVLRLGKEDEDMVAIARWIGNSNISGLRYPNNVTEQYGLENSKAYIDMLNKYAMNEDALYLNMKTIAKMGGGDVDGDTVALLRNRLHNIAVRTHAVRSQQLGENNSNITTTGTTDFNPRSISPADFADMMYRSAVSTFQMSQISKASDALAQGNWNDPNWVKYVGRGGYDLKAMYDIDSTFLKTGIYSKWSALANNAKDMGTPFAAVFKNLLGAVTEGDYSKMMDFSDINLPSIYSGLTVGMLESIQKNPLSNKAIERLIEAQENIQGFSTLKSSGRSADVAKLDYLKKNNEIIAGYLTRGAIPADSDIDELEALRGSWQEELRKARSNPDITSQNEIDYYNNQWYEATKQQKRLQHAQTFGITQSAIAAGKGYSKYGFLKNNPLLTDRTIFSQSFDESEDAIRVQNAAIEGASEIVLDAIHQVPIDDANRQRALRAAGKVDNKSYSWSLLHKLETGSASSINDAYNEIFNGIYRSQDSKAIAFGDSMSKLLQEYADYAVNNNQQRGTSEQWTKRLNEILQTQHGNYFSTLPTEVNTSFTEKDVETYKRMVAFAEYLPKMFNDEEILGAEVVVNPRMGVRSNGSATPLNSIGRIDLQTRNKNGEIINTEMKPRLSYDFLWDQVNLYNPDRNATYARALSYADTRDYSNPDNYTKIRKYEENEMLKVEGRMQALTKGLQFFAKNGADPNALLDFFMPFKVNTSGNYVSSTNPLVSAIEIARNGIGRQIGIEASIADKTGYETARKGSLIKSSEEIIQEKEEINQRKYTDEDRELIGKKTGQGIAKAMSLESDIRDYEKQLNEIGDQLFSREYRANKILSGQTGKSNIWERFERQLGDLFAEEMKEFIDRGASDSDKARLENANKRALENYERALERSASGDYIALANNLDEKIQAHGTSSSARSYASEFDSLTESIEQASQAYEKLKKDLREELKINPGEDINDEQLEAKVKEGIITREKADAYYEAQAAQVYADKKIADYKKILNQDSNIYLQQRLDVLTQQSTGKPLSQGEKIDRQLIKFRADIDRYKNDINLLEEKGVISKDEASKYLEGINKISTRQYEGELIKQAAKKIGITGFNPQEDLENWKNERYSLLDIIYSKKLNDAHENILDLEYDPLSTLFQRQKAEAEYERIKQEHDQRKTQVDDQANGMLERLNRQRQQQIEDYQRELSSGTLTSSERANRKVQQLKDQIATMRDSLNLDDPLRAEYDNILNNAAAWNQYTRRTRESEYAQEVMRNTQARISRRNLDTLFSGEDLSEREEIDQMYDQMKIQRDRYKADHINDANFNRQEFEREYSNSRMRERAREQVRFDREQRSLQLEAESNQIESQLYSRQMSKEEEKQYRLARAKATRNAYARKLRKAGRSSDSEAFLLSNTDQILEDYINAQIDNSTVLQQLQRQNSLANLADQGDIRVYNMRKAYERANTQQRMQYSNSRILRAVYGVRQRRENAQDQVYSLDNQIKEAKRTQDYYAKQLEFAKKSGNEKEIETAQFGYDQATQQLANLGKASAEANAQLNELNQGGQTASAIFNTLGQSVGMLAQRLGRQLFHKALQETKQFVQQFDASMTEIQMITMKSDAQISDLGQGLIQKAVDLRVNVSDVTSAAASLYRQGLSDEEVSTRMEDVIKFSKVAKIGSAEADKIITTAIQNGLVSDSGEAMDALVALGDTAATTASEIAKGMQKSAAAANEAKVSYGELVTLLTIGTSKTQLGGSSVGTALNTLFYRLYKVGEGEDYTDENGNRVSSTAVSRALKAAGVNVYNGNGSFRGAYSILTELGSRWNGLDDTTQSLILSQLGAGRQRNNVATILQGLAEDNGELAGRYMSTATSSSGITDTKYEAYLESLAAKQAEVKSSFDQLIASFEASDSVGGFLNIVSDLLQGLTAFNQIGDGAVATATAIIAALAGIGVAASALATHPVIAALLGIGAVIVGGASVIGNIAKTIDEATNPEVQYQNQLKEANERYVNYTTKSFSRIDNLQSQIDSIDKMAESITNAGEAMDSAANTELSSAIKDLQFALPEMNQAFDESANAIDNWKNVAQSAKDAVSDLRQSSIEYAEILNAANYKDIDKTTREAAKKINDTYGAPGGANKGYTFSFDEMFLGEIRGKNGSGAKDILKFLTGKDSATENDLLLAFLGINENDVNTINTILSHVGKSPTSELLEKVPALRNVPDNVLNVLSRANSVDDLFNEFSIDDFSGIDLQLTPEMGARFSAVRRHDNLLAGSWSDPNLNGVYVTDDINPEYLSLFKWIYSKGLAGKTLNEYYDQLSEKELEQEFNDSTFGMTLYSDQEKQKEIRNAMSNLLADTISGENNYLPAYKEERLEKLDNLANTAIKKYVDTNTIVKQSDINDYVYSALIGYVAENHAEQIEKGDLSFIDFDTMIGLDGNGTLMKALAQWQSNPLEFAQQYGDIKQAQYQYNSKGFNTEEEVIAQMRKDAETNLRESQPIYHPKDLDELVNKYYSEWRKESKTDLFSSIALGQDTYRTADKNRTRYSADSIYESLKNVNTIADLINVVNGEGGAIWSSFLTGEGSEIANWLSGFGVFDETGKITGFRENVSDETILRGLRQRVSTMTANYTAAEYVNRINAANDAQAALDKYLEGEISGQEYGEYSQLEAVLGSALAGKIAAGTASTVEKEYARRQISKYKTGSTAYTAREQLSAMDEISRMLTEGGITEALTGEAAQYYRDAVSRMTHGQEFLTLAQEAEAGEPIDEALFDQYKQEFETLRDNSQIAIDIEGVQDLEEAGKVAAGTAAQIEKLKQGGKVAIDVMINYGNESFEAGQQRALLYGGTQQQQYEAARALLGMSQDQFYGNGMAQRNYESALEYDRNYRQGQDVETALQIYNAAATDEERRQAIEAAANRGVRISESNGPLSAEWYTERYNAATTEADKKAYLNLGSKYYSFVDGKFINATAEYDEDLLNIAAANPLLYASRQFTNKERQEALQRIISGELKYSPSTAEEYMAAYNAGGAYTQEYIRKIVLGEEPNEDIKRGFENEQRELSNVFAENYDLSTVGGQYAYRQALYEYNNRAAIAANNVYGTLTGGGIETVEDLAKAVNETDVANWTTLLESSDELRKHFDDMGVKVSEDGKSLDFSEVNTEASSFASALAALVTAVSSASEHFNKVSEVLSTGQTYTNATNYVTGIGNEEAGFNALSQVTGNSRLAQTVRNNWAQQIQEGWEVDDQGNIIDNTGAVRGRFDAYKGMSPYNRTYAETLMNNAAIGISGLTDIQRYNGLMDIVSAARTRGLSKLRASDQIGAFADYTSGISGANTWLQATEALESANLSWEDLDQLTELPDVLSNIFASLEQAKEANDNFNQSVSEAEYILKRTNKYGSEYSVGLKMNSKDLKTANSAAVSYNQTIASIMKRQEARTKFRDKKEVSEDLVSMTGMSKETLEKAENRDAILKQLEQQELEDTQSIQAIADGYMDSLQQEISSKLSGQTIDLTGLEFNVDTGGYNVDLGNLAEMLGSDVAAQLEAIAASLAGQGINSHFEFFKDGNGAPQVRLIVDKLGRGGGGRGGGGGGKSDVDKLMEAQKHRISSIEHENNMLAIQAEDAARTNNIPAYQSLIDDQIAGQTKLRDAYRQNIAELNKQLSGLKAESDDWWKVKEAIQSAEEAVAKYNANVAELESKRLQEVIEAYEYESSLATHETNMLGLENRSQRRYNEYSAWRENIAQRAASMEVQLVLDTSMLDDYQAELNSLIASGNGNDDYARELRQKINDLIESSTSLQMDIEELGDEVVELNRTMLDNSLVTPQHWEQVYSTQSDMARRNRQWGAAAGIYNRTAEDYQNQRERYQASIARNRADLENAVKESTEWYDLLREIYDEEEALLDLTVKEMDLEMQRLQDVTSAYDDLISHMQHLENMQMGQFDLDDYTNDYTAMFTDLNNYVELKRADDQIYAAEIERLTKILEDEDITEETRIETEKAIEQAEEERLQVAKDINDIYQKRLEIMNQKHERELSPLAYEQDMLGFEQERDMRLNDYEGYIDTIDRSNRVHRDNIATIRDQLKELQAEQALVAEDSDAWWEWQQQIENANKQLEENMKAIDDNNKKRLEALKIKQQNEDKPENYAFDMYNLAVSRAQMLDDYNGWEGVMNDRLEEIRGSIAQNKAQVAEAEALLATYVEGSTEWINTRDQIWAIKKDTAQKENEALQIEQQIDAQRLAEIQKEASRRSAYDEHRISMLDIAANVYQNFGNYNNYRESLNREYESYQNIRDSAVQARDAALAQMDTLEKGTTAWYNARDAVYAYDKAISSATNSMLEKQLAIEASRIQQLTTEFNDSQLENNVMLQTIRAQRQYYDSQNDFENYKRLGEQEKQVLDQQINDKKTYLAGMKDLLRETTIGTQNWYSLRATIAQTMADITNMEFESQRIDQEREQSAIDHMLEKMDWEDSNRQHNLTLIQYEQTRYQNAGELSNYGIMLEKENELRQKSIEANLRDIETLKVEQDTLEKGSKEYNRITEAIKKKEEAISADTVAIEKNTKAIRENANEIQKTRTALEDVVEKEIKTREEQRKKRLNSEVSLQKTILETIRQRFRDEWSLIQKDVEKKKEALEKEKSLINERLNARKEAMQQEERYSELEELQRQLALISNDPTRTRDANELRERIRDIEKDISWDKAYEEAEAATQQIDDEIQAMSDYVTVHGDNLTEMLENANNFATQIDLILSSGWESVSNFLTQNNTEFKNSLAEAQQEMLEGWEQTWKDMNGIIDAYWDQISEILSSYENFVNFMKDSTEYINSSEAGKAVLQFGWEVLYENWLSSGLISPEAVNYQTDEHPWYDASSDLTAEDILGQDWDWLNWGKAQPEVAMNDDLMNVPDYNNAGVDTRAHAVDLTDIIAHDTYAGVGITREEEAAGYEGGTSYNKPVETGNISLNIDMDELMKRVSFDIPEYQTPHIDYTQLGKEKPETPKADQKEEENLPENPVVEQPETHEQDDTGNSNNNTTGNNKPEETTSKQNDNNHYHPYKNIDLSNYGYNNNTAHVPNDEALISTPEERARQKILDTAADIKAQAKLNNIIDAVSSADKPAVKTWHAGNLTFNTEKEANEYADFVKNHFGRNLNVSYYKHGGLVDYTGPAWVDGTPSQPESFLDASDTKLLRKLTDALTCVSINTGVWPNGSDFMHGDTNFGNISIVINQAELKDDADYEDVAKRIGRAFTKEMSRKGYNMTGYNL